MARAALGNCMIINKFSNNICAKRSKVAVIVKLGVPTSFEVHHLGKLQRCTMLISLASIPLTQSMCTELWESSLLEIRT